MQRLMMTSSTYRQSSTVSAEAARTDPENIFLSHMPLRRMDAEVLNDTLIYVAGRLDDTRYGPAEPVLLRDDGLVTPINTGKGWRRSIYIEQRRTEIPTLLENFDLPPMSPNCIDRPESTVSLQALYLMNNGMVRELAESLAERVGRDAGADPQKQVDRLYWLALSRAPSREEAQASLKTLLEIRQLKLQQNRGKLTDAEAGTRALAELCHTVINSAPFIYID